MRHAPELDALSEAIAAEAAHVRAVSQARRATDQLLLDLDARGVSRTAIARAMLRGEQRGASVKAIVAARDRAAKRLRRAAREDARPLDLPPPSRLIGAGPAGSIAEANDMTTNERVVRRVRRETETEEWIEAGEEALGGVETGDVEPPDDDDDDEDEPEAAHGRPGMGRGRCGC